jgi:hypothetical protein
MASPTPQRGRVQVVFDRAVPHELVRSWAAPLGMDVEATVEQLLATGHLSEAETAMLERRRQFAEVAACRGPDRRLPRVFLQRVPEGKAPQVRVWVSSAARPTLAAAPR